MAGAAGISEVGAPGVAGIGGMVDVGGVVLGGAVPRSCGTGLPCGKPTSEPGIVSGSAGVAGIGVTGGVIGITAPGIGVTTAGAAGAPSGIGWPSGMGAPITGAEEPGPPSGSA